MPKLQETGRKIRYSLMAKMLMLLTWLIAASNLGNTTATASFHERGRGVILVRSDVGCSGEIVYLDNLVIRGNPLLEIHGIQNLRKHSVQLFTVSAGGTLKA